MALKVRTLTILSPHVPDIVEATVACPTRGKAVPLSECRHCASSTPFDDDDPLNVECELDPTRSYESASIIERRIRDVASVEVSCALGDCTVRQATLAITGLAIGCLPVVAEDRTVIGLVSAVDLVGATPDAEIRSVMTRAPVTLAERTTLVRASAIMAFEGIHHVPVVDPQGRLSGLLSSLDILRAVGELGKYMIPRATQRQRTKNET